MAEPKDLIERLRAGICGDRCRFMEARLGCECDEAAESIHSLAAENAAMREAINCALSILEDACIVNDAANRAWTILSDALTGGDNAEG